MNTPVKDFDPVHRIVFEAYGCLEEHSLDYVKTHYTHYCKILEEIGNADGLTVLELGASPPFAFTPMLLTAFQINQLHLAQASGAMPGGSCEELASQEQLKIRSSNSALPDLPFTIHKFNAEQDSWPFDSGSIDLVICMEILEHLLLDPCFLFRECHRVLRPGGKLLLTTPNLASMEGVHLLLQNRSPYRYGAYSQYGAYGRHNREFVPAEIDMLGNASGFSTQRLVTLDCYPMTLDLRDTRKTLEKLGDNLDLRGQNIFYTGVKQQRTFDRYPPDLYSYEPGDHLAVIRVLRADKSIVRGTEADIQVELFNNGHYEWKDEETDLTSLGVRLLDAGLKTVNHEFQRVRLRQPVPPGESLTLSFTVRDPGIGPNFGLRLDMIHDNVCWFAEQGHQCSRTAVIRVSCRD